MGTFSMWRALSTKAPRQITWVCGSERILVEDVVTTIRRTLAPEDYNYVTLSIGEDYERDVWAALDLQPVGSGNRLVVVRNANLIQSWGSFMDWVKYRRLNPRTYVVLVSNDDRLLRDEPSPEAKRRGAKPTMAPHLLSISAPKGHLVECRPFTQETAPQAVLWVQAKIRVRDGVAAHLLNRANGDLRLVRDVCVKLAAFPDEITLTTINEVLSERPRETFADALIALDKKTALLALEETPPSEYGRMIGYLDSRLDLAGLVHDMQSEFKSPSEIARAAGNKGFLVKDLIPVAKHYDAARRLGIRKMMVLVDEALTGGQQASVMQALVAFW